MIAGTRRDFLRFAGRAAGASILFMSTPGVPDVQAAALACGHPEPAVRVDASLPQPVLDNSKPQRAIQALAPGYHGGRTIGLYFAEVSAKVEMQFRAAWLSRASSACVFITGVDVRFAMPTRRIYVASEFWPGTCQYGAVLAHERKHEAADDRLIREHAPRIQQAVRDAVMSLSPLEAPANQRGAAQARLQKAVQAAFDKTWAAFQAERSEAQRQVDAGLEYARVTASCPDWSQLRQ
jgi:hypothetical protein